MKRRNLISMIIMGILLIFLYLWGAFYFKGHTYPNTSYKGISVGNMNHNSLSEFLDKEDSFDLIVKEGELTYKINGASINYDKSFERDKIKIDQNYLLWPIDLLAPRDLPDFPYSISYDGEKLREEVEKLPIYNGLERKASKDAFITEGESSYVIHDEFYGNEIDVEALYESIKKAVDEKKMEVNLDNEKPYIKPEVTKDSESLQDELDSLNAWVGTDITLDIDGEKQPLVDWKNRYGLETSENPDFEEYNKGIYEKIADAVAEKYNTVDYVRVFKNSMGNTIYLDPGTFGWRLAYDRFIERLNENVARGKVIDIPVPFNGVSNGVPPNDIGNSYIEIDLTSQHLWIYVDGNLLINTPIVSGNINISGRETPTGVYYIMNKYSPAKLEGPGYVQPVTYWMPFTNEGHGLHDAEWINNEGYTFGGETYTVRGSRGCINLPPDLAKNIYDAVYPGMPVIIYKSSEAKLVPENVELEIINPGEELNIEDEEATTDKGVLERPSEGEQ